MKIKDRLLKVKGQQTDPFFLNSVLIDYIKKGEISLVDLQSNPFLSHRVEIIKSRLDLDLSDVICLENYLDYSKDKSSFVPFDHAIERYLKMSIEKGILSIDKYYLKNPRINRAYILKLNASLSDKYKLSEKVLDEINNPRIIKTERNLERINKGISKGYRPLIRLYKRDDSLQTKFKVVQHKETGHIEVAGDYRFSIGAEYEEVIPWTDYYPYDFESPYGAYMIPDDIRIGERVIVEDLIEDYCGETWNQGSSFRLQSCDAVWNGKDLEYIIPPISHVMG